MIEFGQTSEKESDEINVPALVIANLPQAIIACNARGEILLYNKQVITILKLKKDNDLFSFLGQKITSLIDKNLIEHTLDEINERLKKNVLDTISYFIFKVHQQTIQAGVTPLLDSAEHFKGFILILDDITRQNNIDKKMETILHSLAKNARSPIASIRAAIEAMREFPRMDQTRQEKFKEIIYNESLALSHILNDVSETYSCLTGIKKSIESIPPFSLLETIARRSSEKLNIELNLEDIDKDIQIKADRYAISMVILFLLSKLKDKTGNREFVGSLSMENMIANIDFYWQGKPLKTDMIKRWEDQYPDVSGQIFPLTLKETINANHAALWPFEADNEHAMPYLRVLIPGEKKKTFQTVKPMNVLL